MKPSRAAVRAIAIAILEEEHPPDAPSHVIADAAAMVCTKLHRHLGEVLGRSALDILLRRGLVLARRSNDMLAGVSLAPDGLLEGFDAVARNRDRAAVHDAAVALLARFVEPLTVLIGDELTLRLLRDIWPSLAHARRGTGSEETEG